MERKQKTMREERRGEERRGEERRGEERVLSHLRSLKLIYDISNKQPRADVSVCERKTYI